MTRRRGFRLFVLLFVLPVMAMAAPALEFGTHVELAETLLYGTAFEPGIDALGLGLDATLPLKGWELGAGIDAETVRAGNQVLLSCGPGFRLALGDSLEVAASLRGLGGLSLTRPAPIFVAGASGSASLGWFFGRSWGLTLDLGLSYLARFDADPYSAATLLQVPLGLGLAWR